MSCYDMLKSDITGSMDYQRFVEKAICNSQAGGSYFFDAATLIGGLAAAGAVASVAAGGGV